MVVRSISVLSFALVASIVAAPGCSWGQQPASVHPANEPVADRWVEKGTSAEPSSVTAASEDAPLVEAGQAPHAAEVAAPAPASVHDLTSRMAALQTEVEGLKATVAALQQALANSQDQSELSRSALGAMAEDSQLRSGLAQMLQGKLRLINQTGENKVLYINGTPWTVLMGETYIFVPVGMVSFVSESSDSPTFKGIQEWNENHETDQLELEYRLGESSKKAPEEGAGESKGENVEPEPTETSVLMPVLERAHGA